MSKQKGNRRERQAEKFYTQAGYKTEKSQGMRWDRTDWFGHFDLMAVRSDDFRFVQVKSNEASGISDINAWARRHGPPGIRYDMLVCHDRKGWRLIALWPEADTYTTLIDERDMDGNMGEGVLAYLRGEIDA